MSKRALNELESAKLLSEAGIQMVRSVVLTEDDESRMEDTARDLGFPLVMKILSDDILHKTDAGCVKLNIGSVAEMKDAYQTILNNARAIVSEDRIQGIVVQQMLPKGFEVLLGVSTDPQFGRIIMVGLGGIYVELLKAVSMRVLPIEREDAEQMIDETPLKKACKGLRGVQYDREEIVNALLHLSDLVAADPSISEVDINPFVLFGNEKKATAVDAVVILEQ